MDVVDSYNVLGIIHVSNYSMLHSYTSIITIYLWVLFEIFFIRRDFLKQDKKLSNENKFNIIEIILKYVLVEISRLQTI